MKKNIVRAICAIISMLMLTVLLGSCTISIGDSDYTKKIIDTSSSDVSGASDSTTAAEQGEKDISISEHVLVDKDGIKITAKSLVTDDFWGQGIKVLIENDSNIDISVSCDSIVVNDYMVNELFSATVAAGKKSNEVIYLSDSDLKEAGIKTVEQIEVRFLVINSSTYDRVFLADNAIIKTTAFSGGQFAKNDEGKELVNKDGIRIVGKYVKNDEILGKEIILFVENNTDKDITLYCDDLSVNGFMMTALLAKTVNAGKMSIVGISLFSDDLQKNDIKEVKDIELKFRVGDAVTYSNIFETGVISFSVS